ncbi:M56 family metallopeptidase [Pedobacter sp. KR3-3]|uniref:M56 family metallopeptidase n=1 Tax=Pedobacter albus TaxID=3113905 RepID=A0ABU7I9A8_9SPHI|nr:M56 family metallopeptidase [Pedobacter sp. KR3-3]MEE1946062.1 M56 family metallopeptidase [Pedobacter sp. KR3-3]
MEWLLYLLKVSACSALFFAFYVVALRKLTFFRANRFYLLFSLLLSFVIPALNVEIEKVLPPIVLQASTQEVLPSAQVQPMAATAATTASSVNWMLWLSMLYTIIVVALLALTLWRLLQLLKHTNVYNRVGGLKLIHKNAGFTNCSFFNYVFIGGEQLTAEEFSLLLKHEEVHARQYHSVDKLLLHIAKAVLWFNPVVYYYAKELEQLHEYEADAATSYSYGTRPYAGLLLKLAVQEYGDPLVHNFVKSPIKERIKMLYQSKSKNMKKLSYVLALPIASGLVWGFAVNIVYAQEKVIETKNVPVKELRVNRADEVKTENITLKGNGTLKARTKAGAAATDIVAVNDVRVIGSATGGSGGQVSEVRGGLVRGTIDRVVDSRNDVVVVAKADDISNVRVAGVGRTVNDVTLGNLQGQTRSVGVARSGNSVQDLHVTGSGIARPIEQKAGLYITKEKIVLLIDENTTKQELEAYQEKLKEKDITLSFNKLKFENNKISYLEIAVSCKNGPSGTASGEPNAKDKIGFYRVFDKNAPSNFGIGFNLDPNN